MADAYTEFINNQRERDQRVALTNQVQLGAGRAAVQAQPNGLTSNSSGYWDGGGYKEFFTFGSSKFGSADVME